MTLYAQKLRRGDELTPPDPDWEDAIREEEAAREAHDDECLHAILDEGGKLNG